MSIVALIARTTQRCSLINMQTGIYVLYILDSSLILLTMRILSTDPLTKKLFPFFFVHMYLYTSLLL